MLPTAGNTKITTSQLRSKLLIILDKVFEGGTVSKQNKGKQVAFLIPPWKIDWHSNIKVKAELLADPESAFTPMDDIQDDLVTRDTLLKKYSIKTFWMQ